MKNREMLKLNCQITGGNEGSQITVKESVKDGILYVAVHMEMEKPEIPEQFRVTWYMPDIDVYSYWSPSSAGNIRSVNPNWAKRKTDSRLASCMPLHQLISLGGNNRSCISVSDAFTPMTIGTGVNEADAMIECCVEFFTFPTSPIASYDALIRIDMRDIPYYDCIYDTVAWWEMECGYEPAYVPEAAKMPLDSLWYSFHQNLTAEKIVKECTLSKEMGMEVVIVDDGWQTDDNNRGYAFCGDWELCTRKIPDMKELVDKVHEIGMKFILWYSVPFVGTKSKIYPEFEGMYIDGPAKKDTYALDPRYKKVRDYLVNTYVDAVKNWGLDGLKLDFINSFTLRGESLKPDSRRDYSSLEEAIDALMLEIREKLTAINPEILIEFRQSYVGPSIRKYGNLLRVADCPNDAIKNRMGVIDLRFTSGKTAVHSDMLMWNYEEPVESAALQFVPTLYGIPQISMRIDRLSAEHKKMLQFYIDFWKANKEVLLDGKLTAQNPESCYSIACSTLEDTEIYTVYTDNIIPAKTAKTIAVNGSSKEFFLVRNCKGRKYRVVSCMGEEVETGVVASDLQEIAVPRAGILFAE